MKKYIFTEEQIKKVLDGIMIEQEDGIAPNEISLKDRLLFIVDNIKGEHTDDMVTQKEMLILLKQVIENFVNPDDTIPYKEWNELYHSITNDRYA